MHYAYTAFASLLFISRILTQRIQARNEADTDPVADGPRLHLFMPMKNGKEKSPVRFGPGS
jgi:hypothetical protein